MTAHEQKLLAAAELLYSWILLPIPTQLPEVRAQVEPVLRLYESDVVRKRAEYENKKAGR